MVTVSMELSKRQMYIPSTSLEDNPALLNWYLYGRWIVVAVLFVLAAAFGIWWVWRRSKRQQRAQLPPSAWTPNQPPPSYYYPPPPNYYANAYEMPNYMAPSPPAAAHKSGNDPFPRGVSRAQHNADPTMSPTNTGVSSSNQH